MRVRMRAEVVAGLVMGAVTLVWCVPAGAVETAGRQEVSRIVARYADLPQYCQVRLATRDIQRELGKAPPPELADAWRRWEQVLGPGSLYVHHYCWGLQKLDRARQTPSDTEQGNLMRMSRFGQAAKEMQFAIARVDRSFPLLPEMLVNQARAYVELGQFDRAVKNLLRAISVKRDYRPAYADLISLLRRLGRDGEADEVAARARSALGRGAAGPDRGKPPAASGEGG